MVMRLPLKQSDRGPNPRESANGGEMIWNGHGRLITSMRWVRFPLPLPFLGQDVETCEAHYLSPPRVRRGLFTQILGS